MSTILSDRTPVVSERVLPAQQTALATRLTLVGLSRQTGLPAALKRLLDLMLAIATLPFVLIPMAMIAVLILLDDGRPIIFAQERLGKNGKPFTVYKFRSMRHDAEERLHEVLEHNHHKDGPIFKLKDDPRMTRVGRFIRRTSLDELPQLANVLLGQMSFVGPRPPLASEVLEYEGWQLRRLAATPGLTGLWQVSGRSDLTFTEMATLDIEYLERWSLAYDIALLLRTPAAVLSGRGAY